jgi:dolichol-phosphate mannosyltransferase
MTRFLTALPVYNELKNVNRVLDEVVRYADDVLVVDDGSTDGTSELLEQRQDIQLVTHDPNRGYGAALITAFDYAVNHGYDLVVTIDCDGQHEPQRIREFVAEYERTGADIISGSRYREQFGSNTPVPIERRRINHHITQVLNARLGLNLTDSFCGFKAYKADALPRLRLTETGYAMPLELWVQAACHSLEVVEFPVPLIYLDETRSFGGQLDNGDTRLKYYLDVLERSLAALPKNCAKLRQR